MSDSQRKIDAKRALLRALDSELDALTGRFLSDPEQLRVLSIGEEQDRLEAEIRDLGGEP
jgi:hypothetical protein